MSSMNGLVLTTLKSRVNFSEKANARNEKSLSNNNRDINKKNSQIKKLSLEIEQMESENKKWVVNIEEIKEDIKNTQNIISKNNLVSKNASFQNLQKQTKSLAKEKARLTQKIDKSKETLAREKR